MILRRQKTGAYKESAHLSSKDDSQNGEYNIFWYECSHGIDENTADAHVPGEKCPLEAAGRFVDGKSD